MTDEAKPPREYEVGDKVIVRSWTGTTKGTVAAFGWTYHHRSEEYMWGYRVKTDDGGSTGLTMVYIPGGYILPQPGRAMKGVILRRMEGKYADTNLLSLARTMKEVDISQKDIYDAFTEVLVDLDGEEPGYDALVDTMDLIESGPWAKGKGLFENPLNKSEQA